MRNWKRLKPCEFANNPDMPYELAESGFAVLHCEAKGDVLPPFWDVCGEFLVNCDGVPMFNGSKGLWRLDSLCERYRVWYYIVPAFDGVT